ncbi:glycosyltransferase [Paenibacillus elgii]
MMRVLHITETMASGVLKYIQEVVSIKENKNLEHYIVYSKREHTPNNLHQLFPKSVYLIGVNIKIKGGFLDSLQTLYQQISNLKPDIIHLHSSIAGFFGRLITVFFPKTKVYYTPHGYSFLMTDKNIFKRGFYWSVEFLLSQISGKIVACSKSEYQYAKKLSPLREVILLENCINAVKRRKPSSFHKQVIGVGRMEEQKNPKLFVKIVSELKKIDSEVKAIWIGDGSLRAECEELSRELKANVMFTGWLSNAETLKNLGQSSVFLQTSKWEGLPYSVLEAFAEGLPVVASDISSHKELIGDTYLGFIAKSEQEYTDLVMLLLNDVPLANNMSEENFKRLKLNYMSFVKKLNCIYKD